MTTCRRVSRPSRVEQGWNESDRMSVAAVGMTREGTGRMKGALSETSRVTRDAEIVIRGNVAATRGGTAGGYMALFVEPTISRTW